MLLITVVGGVLLAVLFDRKFIGQGIARLLVIAPFFVMPTVSALIWKNMILHPVYGLSRRPCEGWACSRSTGSPTIRCSR